MVQVFWHRSSFDVEPRHFLPSNLYKSRKVCTELQDFDVSWIFFQERRAQIECVSHLVHSSPEGQTSSISRQRPSRIVMTKPGIINKPGSQKSRHQGFRSLCSWVANTNNIWKLACLRTDELLGNLAALHGGRPFQDRSQWQHGHRGLGPCHCCLVVILQFHATAFRVHIGVRSTSALDGGVPLGTQNLPLPFNHLLQSRVVTISCNVKALALATHTTASLLEVCGENPNHSVNLLTRALS